MICPNCKTQNVEGAQFCRSCGTSLTGSKKNKGSRFRYWTVSVLLTLSLLFFCYSLTCYFHPYIFVREVGSKFWADASDDKLDIFTNGCTADTENEAYYRVLDKYKSDVMGACVLSGVSSAVFLFAFFNNRRKE